jgi:hypothetical protein
MRKRGGWLKMFEPNTHRMATCEWCGKRFADDCGDSFCSSSCENSAEEYHKKCEGCGCEQEDVMFPDGCYCGDCLDEMEEEEND